MKVNIVILIGIMFMCGGAGAATVATEGFVRSGLATKVDTADVAALIAAEIAKNPVLDDTNFVHKTGDTMTGTLTTDAVTVNGTMLVRGSTEFAGPGPASFYNGLNVHQSRITELAQPIAGQDGANKAYVDMAIMNASIPTTGSAVGNVPMIGTALGTTANNLVATNTSGGLIPTGIVSTNIVTLNGTHTITGVLNVPTQTLP